MNPPASVTSIHFCLYRFFYESKLISINIGHLVICQKDDVQSVQRLDGNNRWKI